MPEISINIENNPCEEHEEYNWFTFDEAVKRLKYQNNKEAFEKLRKIL